MLPLPDLAGSAVLLVWYSMLSHNLWWRGSTSYHGTPKLGVINHPTWSSDSTTHIVLANAVFKPCWYEVTSGEIILVEVIPDNEDWNGRSFVEYCGEIDLRDIHTVLVARNLELTNASKLRFRSLRALAPVHDQLFRFTL